MSWGRRFISALICRNSFEGYTSLKLTFLVELLAMPSWIHQFPCEQRNQATSDLDSTWMSDHLETPGAAAGMVSDIVAA